MKNTVKSVNLFDQYATFWIKTNRYDVRIIKYIANLSLSCKNK